MILMQAPVANLNLGTMPSGSTYVSDGEGMVYIWNNSSADQVALAALGCVTLNPFGGWGTFAFSLLTDLYAADAGALLPGMTGFPQHTVVSIFNDPTHTGIWYKTSLGIGAGNWTQITSISANALAALIISALTNLAGVPTAAATAEAAINAALQAAMATVGQANIFPTMAAATAALGSVAANGYIQVLADETRNGVWTLYQKVAGAYVYQTSLNQSDKPTAEQFGAQGYAITATPSSPVDSYPAIQNMINYNEARGGGFVRLSSGQRYFLSNTLVADPVRTGMDGNGAVLNWGLKAFTDPSLSPNLITNGNFATGDGTGWTIASNSAVNPVFSSGNVQYTQASGAAAYCSFGQQLAGVPAQSRLRLTVVLNYVHTVTTSTTTQNAITFIFGASQDASGNAKTLDNAGIDSLTTYALKNTLGNYTEPMTFTWDVALPADVRANPWFRIDCNANFSIASISVQMSGVNECIRYTSTNEQYGHERFGWHDLGLEGPFGNTAYADGVFFETPGTTGTWSSRVNWFGVYMANFRRGLIFGDNTYLANFYGCHIQGRVAAIETALKTFNAGENISFYGGTLAAAQGAGIINRGMQLNFHGVSIDFPVQWLVGQGGTTTFTECWLEKHKATAAGQYYVDLQGSGAVVLFRGGRFQIDDSDSYNLDSPFRGVAGARMVIEDANMSGLRGTADTLMQGGADIIVRRMIGGANMPRLTARDLDNNRFANGGQEFYGTGSPNFYDLGVDCWLTSVATNATYLDRHNMIASPSLSFTGDVSLGGQQIANTNIPSGNSIAGWLLSGPGMVPGMAIVNFNNSATNGLNGLNAHTLSLTSAANATQTGAALVATNPVPGGTCSVYLDYNQYHSGTRSLRVTKTGTFTNPKTAVLNIRMPIEPRSMAAFEFYMRFGALGGASNQVTVFVDAYWARFASGSGYGGAPLPASGSVSGSSPAAATAGYGIIPSVMWQEFAGLDGHVVVDTSTGQIVSNDLAGATGTGWQRAAFGTAYVPGDQYAPEWATDLLLMINLTALPAGCDMWLDDFIGTVS